MATSSRRSRALVRRSIVGVAALGGAVLAAAPTGVPVLDRLWCAAFVAALAWFGAVSSPFALLPAAALAAVAAQSRVSLALAVVAVIVTVTTIGQARASTRSTAAAAALVGLSLLRGSGPDAPALAALVVVACSGLVVASGLQGMSTRKRRRVLRWMAGGVAVLAVCAALGGLAALRVRSDAQRGIDALRAAQHAGTGGDLQRAVDDARRAERAFRSASTPLRTIGRIGRLVPGLSQQLAAAGTSVDTAGDAAEAVRRAGSETDLDGITLHGGAVDLAKVAATEPALDELARATSRTVVRLAGIDRTALLAPVSNALDDALEEAQRAATTADRLHRAVQVAPDLLGARGTTRYLVLFTSPDEARNRFGFPGAYAVLTADAGRLTFERSGAIDELDHTKAAVDQARLTIPPRADPYVVYGISRTWRSLTMSPDGPTVADLGLQLAAQTDLGRLDGVLLADPEVLAAVVGLVGDVPVPDVGVTLTKDTTVDFLVRRQYLEFPQLGQQQAQRKDLLAGVAEEVGARLSTLSLPRARDLVDAFGPLVHDGHLVLSVPATTRPDAALLFGDVGLDGAFPRPQDAGADVLAIGQRNFVGNKIDLFLERNVRYDVTVDPDGRLEADLTLVLSNTAPASGLPPYLIGSAAADPPPPGTNLTTTLLYSRNRLTSLTVDGVPVTPFVDSDGGLLLYRVDLPIAAGQRRTLQAHLEGTAAPGPYALVTRPGGLVHPDDVSVNITDRRSGGGARSDAFSLVTTTCRAATAADEACRGRG